ncbi:MAG: hypothetical protein M1834_001703 [Cirrosporium novae-zelandiae]|nr:MAG: hypothetical protein M1834_001703 [Cirrosporium novae-zelandiae]
MGNTESHPSYNPHRHHHRHLDSHGYPISSTAARVAAWRQPGRWPSGFGLVGGPPSYQMAVFTNAIRNGAGMGQWGGQTSPRPLLAQIPGPSPPPGLALNEHRHQQLVEHMGSVLQGRQRASREGRQQRSFGDYRREHQNRGGQWDPGRLPHLGEGARRLLERSRLDSASRNQSRTGSHRSHDIPSVAGSHRSGRRTGH